jgi:GT2 family glycosyltransferase
MRDRISIGIVNFNGGPWLRKCVLSALPQAIVSVYDNASPDHSLETIADLDRVTVIRGTENRGYAFACNRLIESMQSELVAVANMDIEFDPAWTEQICSAFTASKEADAVASLVLEQGDPVTVNFAGMGFLPDLHSQSIYAGADPASVPATPAIVFGAYGAAMAFRRSLFPAIGFFDEDYFLFYEEAEFFWRMNLYGRKTIYWTAARVLHYRSLVTRRFSPLKLFYTERNRIYTGLKILPWYRYPGLFLWSAYRLIRMRRAADASQKEKMRERGASPVRVVLTVAAAWLAALGRFPLIMKKRRSLWTHSGASPRTTIDILNRYRVPWKSLSLK